MGVAAAICALAICLGVPLGTLVWLLARNRRLAGVFGLGVVSFFVSQVVLRIPLLQMFENTAWFAVFSATQPFLYMLLLATTASLFEETARFILLRPQRTRAFDLRVPLAFGLGHGGLEALLTGIGLLPLLAAGPAQLDLMVGSLFFAGLERASAIACHVAFTLLVYGAVVRRRPSFFAAALLLHCLLDLSTGLVHYGIVAALLYELLLAACAALQLWLVLKLVNNRKEAP